MSDPNKHAFPRVTNREGLTLLEWLAAAGWPMKADGNPVTGRLGLFNIACWAWKAGEDPTDYRVTRNFEWLK